MIIRTALLGAAAALVLSASPAASQGRPAQPIVSDAAMKSMVSSKPKTKTPLAARVGMVRNASAVAAKPDQAGPTSVREIRATPKKK